MYHYEGCGLKNVWLQNGYTVKVTKFGDSVSINDVDGLHRALALAIVEAARPITPEEFRFLRIELGLSQKSLGALLGISDQSIANYEKSTHKIQRIADVALRSLYLNSINRENGLIDKLQELAELDNDLHRLECQMEREEMLYSEEAGWHLRQAA